MVSAVTSLLRSLFVGGRCRSDIRRKLWCEPLESRDVPSAYHVTSGLDSGAGTLRDAVVQANADPSLVADIYFDGISEVDLQSQLPTLLTVNITIHGDSAPGGQLLITRDPAATGLFSLIAIAPTHTQVYTLNNITFSNGQAVDGGALHTEGATVLNSCLVTNCSATGNGGGIYSGFNLTLNQSTVTSNTAGNDGGGIYHTSESAGLKVIINGGGFSGTVDVISNNTATLGGGIYLLMSDTGEFDLNSGRILGNTASSVGGGIYQVGGSLIVGYTSTQIMGRVRENTATTDGAGIYILSPSFEVSILGQVLANNLNNSPAYTETDVVIAHPWNSCVITIGPRVGTYTVIP